MPSSTISNFVLAHQLAICASDCIQVHNEKSLVGEGDPWYAKVTRMILTNTGDDRLKVHWYNKAPNKLQLTPTMQSQEIDVASVAAKLKCKRTDDKGVIYYSTIEAPQLSYR